MPQEKILDNCKIDEDGFVHIKSPGNPNQEIVYAREPIFTKSISKNNNPNQETKISYNLILLLENSLRILKTLSGKYVDDLLQQECMVREFANTSFAFCKEHGYSFERYAKEKAFNVLELMSIITKNYKKDSSLKLYCTFFDEDCKTAFALYNGNKIKIFKNIEGKTYSVSMSLTIKQPMNSLEEFEEFIKKNRKVLDKTIIENTAKIKAKELEKLASVSEEFQNHGMERK